MPYTCGAKVVVRTTRKQTAKEIQLLRNSCKYPIQKRNELSLLRIRCGVHIMAFLTEWIMTEIIKWIKKYWLKPCNTKIFLVQREKHVLAILKLYRGITNPLRIHRGFKIKRFYHYLFFIILVFKEEVLLDWPHLQCYLELCLYKCFIFITEK